MWFQSHSHLHIFLILSRSWPVGAKRGSSLLLWCVEARCPNTARRTPRSSCLHWSEELRWASQSVLEHTVLNFVPCRNLNFKYKVSVLDLLFRQSKYTILGFISRLWCNYLWTAESCEFPPWGWIKYRSIYLQRPKGFIRCTCDIQNCKPKSYSGV